MRTSKFDRLSMILLVIPCSCCIFQLWMAFQIRWEFLNTCFNFACTIHSLNTNWRTIIIAPLALCERSWHLQLRNMHESMLLCVFVFLSLKRCLLRWYFCSLKNAINIHGRVVCQTFCIENEKKYQFYTWLLGLTLSFFLSKYFDCE